LDLKLTKLEQKLSDLKKLLDRSYGADGEFEHMDGECYPLAVKQYVYEVCPFGKAAQKEGSSSTSLGNWEGLEQAPDDGHWFMKFKGGQSCWQGPQRSLTVHLRCGATNLPLSVDEPSKCVYEMHMETPAVCNEQHAEDVRKRVTGQQEEEEEEGAQHAHQKDEL
jgi:protein kinase C substrate 80K-H